MQKLVLIAAVVLTCLPALLLAGGRGRGAAKAGGGHGDGHHRNGCGQWTEGQCVPSNNATCGAGHQTKTRTGDNCAVKEKTTKCQVPCPTPAAGEAASPAAAAAAGPAGRGGKPRKASKRCDYIKSEWSECDSSNQRTRTFTLNTAAGEQPAHCKQSKTIRKRCPPTNKNRNRGGGRGEGRNAHNN